MTCSLLAPRARRALDRGELTFLPRSPSSSLFTTAEFLAYCGLPSTPPMNVYRSGLIHSDILQLIAAPERGDYRMTKRMLKDAIAGGKSASLPVGIKTRARSQ